jgi:hypothetical protein
MKQLYYLLYIALLPLTGFQLPEKEPPATRSVTLVFHHQLGKEPLETGKTVRNILGDSISIERFKYYISNISLTNTAGKKIKLPVQYFLVDENEPASKIISLSIPDIPISRISFLLGVDSIRNVSGIQTGALDPMKGMFWTWNSGYIMAKLEGTAEALPTPGHRFTYHVGGFRTGMNTAKHIELVLPGNGSVQEIHITADINQWFKSASEIKIAETPVCHSPGALAMKLADNYQNMFSIHSIR